MEIHTKYNSANMQMCQGSAGHADRVLIAVTPISGTSDDRDMKPIIPTNK